MAVSRRLVRMLEAGKTPVEGAVLDRGVCEMCGEPTLATRRICVDCAMVERLRRSQA